MSYLLSEVVPLHCVYLCSRGMVEVLLYLARHDYQYDCLSLSLIGLSWVLGP